MEENMAKCTPLQAHQAVLQWSRQKPSQENTKYLKISPNTSDINYNWIQLSELYTIKSKPHNQPPMQIMWRGK